MDAGYCVRDWRSPSRDFGEDRCKVPTLNLIGGFSLRQICVGHADCPPECTYGRYQLNHPSPWLGTSRWRSWLGTSRWPRSSLWMGSRPPLWMRPSSPLVKTSRGDYSERSRLGLAAFSPLGHTQKPPRFPSTARAVAFAWRRRAVLKRPCLSCLDARPSKRRWVRCQCVGPTIPDPYASVTGGDALQASAAVPS